MRNSQILVVSPLADTGHLNDWHNQIVKAIKDIDLDVVELTPRKAYATSLIQIHKEMYFKAPKNSLEKIVLKKIYILAIKLKSKFFLTQKVYVIVTRSLRKISKIISKRFQTPDEGLPFATWDIVAHTQLSMAINKNVEKIFLTYLDAVSYEVCLELFDSLRVPVVPIVFKYAAKEHTKIFEKLPENSCILTIDERSLINVRRDNPFIDVLKLPDFATIESRDIEDRSSHNLFPNNNIIIGLMGSISYRKSLKEIVEFAQSKQGLTYNWIIAGECFLDRQNDKFKRKFRKLKREQDGNIRVIDKYLSKPEFDELFKLIDIHLVLYKEWNSPSNIATNSILMRKKFIVYENSIVFESLVLDGLALSVKEDFSNFVEVLESSKDFRISEAGRKRFLEKSSLTEFSSTIQEVARS